jgi:ParB/RepB/Spo0J family partition protein
MFHREPMKPIFKEIPIGQIFVTSQVRNMITDDDATKKLTADIAMDGILEPLIVTPEGENFTLVCGHQRLHAAQHIGLDVVPCMVGQWDNIVLTQMRENILRKDLTRLEKGLAYLKLNQEFDMSYRTLEQLFSTSRSTISRQISEARALSQNETTKSNRTRTSKTQRSPLKQNADGSISLSIKVYPSPECQAETRRIIVEATELLLTKVGLDRSIFAFNGDDVEQFSKNLENFL